MVISSDRRQDILNVFQFFEAEKRSGKLRISVFRATDRTARALNVSKSTVRHVLRSDGKGNTSVKSRQGRKRKLDQFDKDCIIQRVQQFFHEKNVLTIKKLKESLSDTFSLSTGLLYKTLSEMGYRFRKTDNDKKIMAENWDIVGQRCAFLRQIAEYRHAGFEIVYVDETWANAHHGRSAQWYDGTGACARIPPSGKGQRLIILHAGSAERGFLPDCDLVFRSKTKSTDYHEEMNGNVFMEWFEHQLLPVLDNPAVIVLDNASYHNIRVPGTECPTMSWKKDRIAQWLSDNKIPFNQSMLKPELYAIAKRNKRPIQYETDRLAGLHGHIVLRTPVRHWVFNAIEIIWAQVKDYIAVNNKSFKLADVETLVSGAFQSVTVENWAKAVQHTVGIEKCYWQSDGLAHSNVERIVIHLDSDTETESDEGGTSDKG